MPGRRVYVRDSPSIGEFEAPLQPPGLPVGVSIVGVRPVEDLTVEVPALRPSAHPDTEPHAESNRESAHAGEHHHRALGLAEDQFHWNTPGSTSSGGPIHAGCGGSSGSSLSPGGGVSGKKSIAASSRTWPLAPRTTDARTPLEPTSATTGGRVALRGMSVTCRDGPADEGEAGRQVRLYLSSFRMGDHPEYLTDLVGGNNQRAAVIANAMDDAPGDVRRSGVERELAALAELGFDTVELDLRGYNDDGNRLRRDLSGLALTW